jgi:hypothetical protein
VRLQATRNRPQLVKDLAAALIDVKMLQQSANPCSVISSRLSGYIKRPCWSAVAPCPLAKELETAHRRRTFYYLTTCSRQPVPDSSSALLNSRTTRAIVTPSLSSSASTSEDAADVDRRRELSLSPEIDLSSPDLEEMEEDIPMPGTPMGSASGRRLPLAGMSRSQRGEPPLEKDEKEFTQTADGLQKRKLSGGLLSAAPMEQTILDDGMQNEQLFGEPNRSLAPSLLPYMAFMTSPAIRPSMMPAPKKDVEVDGWSKLDAMLDWDKSPETVELDELDCLLDDF